MTCPRCGRQAAAGARYCGSCGAELTGAAAAGGERIAAQIEPARVAVAAGSEAGAEVVVRNAGSVVEHVTLTVAGDAAPWSAIEPASMRLMPGASGTAALVLRPPRTSATRAGSHALIVRAAPADNPGVAGQANGIVDVAPFALVTARVVPRNATRWRRSWRDLELENDGNAPVALRLEARDDDDALAFGGLPPETVVLPGAPVHLRFSASARRWRVAGKPQQRDFYVSAETPDGAAFVAPGVLRQRGVLNLLTLLVVLAALAVAVGLGLTFLKIIELVVGP